MKKTIYMSEETGVQLSELLDKTGEAGPSALMARAVQVLHFLYFPKRYDPSSAARIAAENRTLLRKV